MERYFLGSTGSCQQDPSRNKSGTGFLKFGMYYFMDDRVGKGLRAEGSGLKG
ncbi:hypothetical protein BH24BAC1_BH24BAC1_30200 [soil metagenome]